MSNSDEKHKAKMQKQKQRIDSKIAEATEERGLCLLLTGDGKGKSSSAFGMVLRCLGYGYGVGVVQFIKGQQETGEALFFKNPQFFKNQQSDIFFYQMATGFTWNTQDRSKDIAAAERTWEQALQCLQNPDLHLVLLDELTYMLAYKYLDEDKVLEAISNRPREQTVIVTGRGGGSKLRELADTVSEIKSIKHAFQAGLKARAGIDY